MRHKRHTAPLWTCLLTVLAAALLGCTSKPGFDGNGRPAADSSRDGGSTRPTDEGESIPGYLTDPSHIDMNEDGHGGLTVTAGAGQVAAATGPIQAPVFVWQVSRDQLVLLYTSPVDAVTVQGTLLGTVTSGTDGSLSGSVQGASGDPVLLTLTPSSSPGSAPALPGTGGHAVAATRDFSTAESTKAYRAAPQQSGWTPSEVTQVAQSIAGDPELSAAENHFFGLCVTLALAATTPYSQAPSALKTGLSSTADQTTISDPCYEEALTAGSDAAAAGQASGLWNKREVAYFMQTCGDSGKWNGSPAPASRCQCEVDTLSTSVPFLDGLARNPDQPLDSLDPAIGKCQ